MTRGGIKDDCNSCIYFNMPGFDSDYSDAGRKVSRFRGDCRRSGYLLGQEQRPFHGRDACQRHQGFGGVIYHHSCSSEHWKLLSFSLFGQNFYKSSHPLPGEGFLRAQAVRKGGRKRMDKDQFEKRKKIIYLYG